MSYLDTLPGGVQERIRQRLRSPAEYERLREKVKGPEDLERELPRAEAMAELHFALESSSEKAREIKSQLGDDIKEQGVEAILDGVNASPEAKKALEQGKFTLTVMSIPDRHEDALVAVPEGNVQEKLPIKPAFAEKYAGGLANAG